MARPVAYIQMAKANHLKTKETDAVVVTPQSTATVVQSATGTATTSNFILVRAARSDSGQLILQNGHELLSLLNEASTVTVDGGGGSSSLAASLGEGKSIVFQHQRIKTRSLSTDSTNITAVQPIIKSTTLEGATVAGTTSSGGTIFLQSGSLKKGTLTTSDGSIILQQRLTKASSGDGPILLQTLKRLDKTPSILVIRNATSANAIPTTSTATTTATAAVTTKLPQRPTLQMKAQSHPQPQHSHTVTVQRSLSEDRKATRHTLNVPLGSGKYTFMISLYS